MIPREEGYVFSSSCLCFHCWLTGNLSWNALAWQAYDSRVFRTRTSSLPSSSASQLPTDDVERLRKDRAEWARQQQARYQQTKPRIPTPTRSYTAPPPPRTSFPSAASQPPRPAPVPPKKPQQTKSGPVPPITKIAEEEVDVQLLENMMQGLRQLDPEWEQRKMSVLKVSRLLSKDNHRPTDTKSFSNLQRRADRMTSHARSSTVRT